MSGRFVFRANNYDLCMTNKVIDGEKCTVYWYVDDIKISHQNIKVVDMAIKGTEENIGEMVINRGNEHNFVGIDIELKDDGKVNILMRQYIKESILNLGEPMSKGVNTPTKHNLFTVEESRLMDQTKAEKFHLLFLSCCICARGKGWT